MCYVIIFQELVGIYGFTGKNHKILITQGGYYETDLSG